MSFDTTTRPLDHIDVGHSRLAYYRFGEGPDLVFVHGWPLHAATFRHLVAGLADSYTCHLFDLPGTGNAEWDAASEIGFDAHTESVARAIDTLGLGAYGIVGHDSGGLIARRVAAQHGDRVRAVVLGNTEIPGHHPWQIKAFGFMARVFGGHRALRPLLTVRPLRHSALFFGGCFTDSAYGEGDFSDLFVAPLVADRRRVTGQLGLLESFEWESTDSLVQVHEAIRAPSLLVWGDRDGYFPVEKARRMAEQLAGGADFEVIPGAKLFAHEDRAPEFLAAMRPFLARHLGQPSVRVA